jgi:hypothetical protein
MGTSASPSSPRILLIDIETFPNQAFVWGKYQQDVIRYVQEKCIATYAAKWLGETKVFAKSLPEYKGYRAGSYDDKGIAKDLHRLLDEADIVIAHNGCVAPGTKVLRADLTYVPVEDLSVGDQLFAFEDTPQANCRRRFKVSTVTHVALNEQPRLEITLSDNTVLRVTKDHPFLAPNNRGNCANWSWYDADSLKVGDVLTRILPVWEIDTSYEAGYLAAAVDGEGHLTSSRGARIGFAQKSNKMLEEFLRLSKEKGFTFDEYSSPIGGVRRLLLTNIFNVFNFLGTFRPKRLLDKLLQKSLCMHVSREGRTTITKIVDIGVGPIVELSTSTGTYISEGFASHNCSFDIKEIQAAFIRHNLPPPSPFKVIDTKTMVKKVARFNSNKLDDLGKLLFNERKIKTDFDLWEGCIKGDKKAWSDMVRYNKKDVELLEKVYLRLRPWYTAHPNVGIYIAKPGCPKCGSESVTWRGFARTTTRQYRRFQCQECGGWGRTTVSEKLGIRYPVNAV